MSLYQLVDFSGIECLPQVTIRTVAVFLVLCKLTCIWIECIAMECHIWCWNRLSIGQIGSMPWKSTWFVHCSCGLLWYKHLLLGCHQVVGSHSGITRDVHGVWPLGWVWCKKYHAWLVSHHPQWWLVSHHPQWWYAAGVDLLWLCLAWSHPQLWCLRGGLL